MGPRSRPRSPVLLTGRSKVSKGADAGFLRITSSASRRVPAGAPKLARTVYSRRIVRTNDSGRDPSLEPLKRRVPSKPYGDSGLERCGDCAVPTTPQTFSNPASFGDHRGRATYLTALRIKEFSISKGRFPRRAACSCKSRSLVLNKRSSFCFVFGAAGAFGAPTKDACGLARWEVGCARALPAVSELPALAAVAADCSWAKASRPASQYGLPQHSH